jgi:hypothetical protein
MVIPAEAGIQTVSVPLMPCPMRFANIAVGAWLMLKKFDETNA